VLALVNGKQLSEFAALLSPPQPMSR